ncbi:hypothetical protein UPYG_G00279740 [Umbra pygmaea]|uniref:Cardiomyopathy-associated protein 5 n=1 Tax=Umbra pygmaea TaxID=75934 RepID=A0ABD0W3V9_UMBPY
MDTIKKMEHVRTDTDPDTLTMLDDADITEGASQINDEVEDLSNSLRLVVQDEAVRPKMQCLMMDPSFSMVTVQGEDSGIQWETNSSRCSTPWGSETDPITSSEFCIPIRESSATPGLRAGTAGKITFVMDEALMVRRPKTKTSSGGGRKSRQSDKRGQTGDNLGEFVEKPELVEVSLPNIRAEGDGGEEETTDPKEEKKQSLFRLVSEGSEILNILVPPRLVSIDEEESRVMVDNLSYLEQSTFNKPQTKEEVLEEDTTTPEDGGDQTVDVTTSTIPTRPGPTDPPGAPVAKQPSRGDTSHIDYFEPFNLLDESAPGGPTTMEEVREEEAEADGGEANQQAIEELEQPQESAPMAEDTGVSGNEISGDHLDEVFYGGVDDMPSKNYLDVDKDSVDKLPKSPLKESGSALFGSEETILTPIFLPSGPPKIINPTLLEEPTAMAFLYTDLYEEAVGSREGVKDEDTESITSERSFHSRHSDREDRGYLEKFVLIDETPFVELDGEEAVEQGFRTWTQEPYTIGSCPSNPDDAETEGGIQGIEQDMTDFFRTNASSSPSDDRYLPSLDKGKIEAELVTDEQHVKADREVLDTLKKAPQPQAGEKRKTMKESETQAVITGLNEPAPLDGGRIVTEPSKDLDISHKPDAPTKKRQTLPQPLSKSPTEKITKHEAPKPVVPPRRKPMVPLKISLNLVPLVRAQTPAGILEEAARDGSKEERVEEKETASPVETADEGEGDAEMGQTEEVNETVLLAATADDEEQGGKIGQRKEEKEKSSQLDGVSSLYQSQFALLSSTSTDPAKDGREMASNIEPQQAEGKNPDLAEGKTEPPQAAETDLPKPEVDPVLTREDCETEPDKGKTEPEKAVTDPSDSVKPEVEPEKRGASSEIASSETGACQSMSAPVTDLATGTEPEKDRTGCIIL